MKTSIGFFVLLLLGALSSGAAEIEPPAIETADAPLVSPAVLMDGVASGKVRFVADIDAEGRVSDYVGLAADRGGIRPKE